MAELEVLVQIAQDLGEIKGISIENRNHLATLNGSVAAVTKTANECSANIATFKAVCDQRHKDDITHKEEQQQDCEKAKDDHQFTLKLVVIVVAASIAGPELLKYLPKLLGI